MELERWFYIVRLRLKSLFQRQRMEQELEEEFETHLEHRVTEEISRGMSPADARRVALCSFASTTRSKEECRDARGVQFFDQAGENLRYAVRTLCKSQSFTMIALLTLALGSGVTTALFSVVDGVLLRPLPYHDPASLVVVWTDNQARQIHEALTSYPNYQDWQAQSRVFADLALSSRSSPVTITGDGDTADRIDGAVTSANFFSGLGVAPFLGRTFSAEEQQRGDAVVILSYALWRRRFSGAKDVIGRTLELDRRANTVIGVMPPTFQFPSADTQLWRPLRPNTFRDRPIGFMVGRLKPHSSVAEAQAELDFIGNRLARQYSELARNPDFPGFRAKVIPLDEQIITTPVRLGLWILLGAVAFVLLIACSNVANLLLVRGASRQHEFALRAALGASRLRILAQLVTESVVLNVIGGACGIALAELVVRVLIAMAPANLPRLDTVTVDGRVLAFTLTVSALTGIVFGLIPALQLSHSNPSSVLKAGGRGQIGSGDTARAQHALVATEVALALLLLCGAGLLVRSFIRLQDVSIGFQPHNVLTFRVVLSNSTTDREKADFYREVIARLKGLPGVSEAGAISNLFSVSNPDATIVAEGRPETASAGVQVMDDSITPTGFSTLGAPLRRGRFFTEADDSRVPPVAIVNEAFAKTYWVKGDPIGKRFRFGDGRFDGKGNSSWVTVVGIVGDMRRSGMEQEPLAQVFLPMSQMPSRGTDFFIRTAEPQSLSAAVRREIATLDRSVPVYRISTLDQLLARSAESRRFQTLLLGFFATVAVLLAGIGIYGVMHYVVAQRTAELSIRLALGASRSNVLLLVLRGAAKLVLAGSTVGLVSAWLLARSMEGLLYNVTATDPVTFLLATILLACIGLCASLRPALRAATVDPNVALRAD